MVLVETSFLLAIAALCRAGGYPPPHWEHNLQDANSFASYAESNMYPLPHFDQLSIYSPQQQQQSQQEGDGQAYGQWLQQQQQQYHDYDQLASTLSSRYHYQHPTFHPSSSPNIYDLPPSYLDPSSYDVAHSVAEIGEDWDENHITQAVHAGNDVPEEGRQRGNLRRKGESSSRRGQSKGKAVEATEEGMGGEETDQEGEQGQRNEEPEDKRLTRAERLQVDAIWARKGLWVGLDPKELAACIAELKIEMGSVKGRSIGIMISYRFRDHKLATQKYRKQYDTWSRRFSDRARKLEQVYTLKKKENGHFLSPSEFVQKLYVNIRNVRTWGDYVADTRREAKQNAHLQYINRYTINDNETIGTEAFNERKADEEAEVVWNAVIQYLVKPMFRPEDSSPIVPIEMIEKVTRYAHEQLQPFLPQTYSREEIADHLRRYMMTKLQKKPLEMDGFTKARNEWLQEVDWLQQISG